MSAVPHCLLALALLSSCVRGDLPPSAAGGAPWDRFVAEYIESYFAAWPEAAVWAGRHEFDGRLADVSREALVREGARLRAMRARALAFDPGGLDAARRFEQAYVVAQTDGDLFWLERAEGPYRNPTFYLGSLDPDVYVSRPYAPLAVRLRGYVGHARALPRVVAQMRANLRTPLPATYVERGASMAGGLAQFLGSEVPAVFAAVDDPGLQADFAQANGAAVAALRELAAWFKGERGRATGDFALGSERFRDMLWATERVDVPLARLEEIGRADLQRNLTALRTACDRLAPGSSLVSCTERVRARKPPDGPVQAARRQLQSLQRFVLERDLVGVPSTEEALVAEAPPYNRANAAYINIPGPYEKGLPAVYYIAPPDPRWTAKERADYAPGETVLLFISVHEVFPGHFVQFLHSNRTRSTFGRLFRSTAFTEGWAHYVEEMTWEAGLGDGDASVHVGELLQALVRNVRFLAAIGLHTGGMGVAEAERLFREQAFQDAGNARQQAARGTYDPAYLSYTLGKLMLGKLREEWTRPRQGRAAWRAFHDTVLSYGAPPIPLIRDAMLGPDAGPAL